MSQQNLNNSSPAQNNVENQNGHLDGNEAGNADGNRSRNNEGRNNNVNEARDILNEYIVPRVTRNQLANAARNRRGYEIAVSNENRNNHENDDEDRDHNPNAARRQNASINRGINGRSNNLLRIQHVPQNSYSNRIPIFYAANSTLRRYVIYHNGHLDNFFAVLQQWSLGEAIRAITIESHIRDIKQYYALTNPTFQVKPLKCCDMVNETDDVMTEYENTSFWHNNKIYKIKMMHIAKSNKVDSTTDPFDFDSRTIYIENIDFQTLFGLPRHFPRFYRMFHGPCQISYDHPRSTFYVYIEFINSCDAFDAMYHCLRHFGDSYVRFKRLQTRNLYEHWGCTRVVYSLLEDYRPFPSGLIGRKFNALTDDERIRRSNWIVNPSILIEAFNHF